MSAADTCALGQVFQFSTCAKETNVNATKFTTTCDESMTVMINYYKLNDLKKSLFKHR